ncbi:MAG: YdcF family protein [Bdellovibrionales bacterium]
MNNESEEEQQELSSLMEDKILQTGVWLIAGILFLFSLLFINEYRLIRSQEVSSFTQNFRADCGVVLTGGAARISEGFSLLTQKRIKKLIISGVHPSSDLKQIFPQFDFYGNILESDVILEKRSKTTYGNAKQSSAVIEALQCKDLILVTSRLHMRRSVKTFAANLPEGYPIYPRSVIHGRISEPLSDIWLESLKSSFYFIWAY